MSFEEKVWTKLSSINVNEHVQKKMNLSFLSWTWAWATLMEHFPKSSYSFDKPIEFSDGSVEIWCHLTIQENDDKITRSMFLPVMDHRNNAIKSPTTRQISDTRMRCLVKAMAMFGLGHYIYAGEDIPESEKKDLPSLLEQINSASSREELVSMWRQMSKKEQTDHEKEFSERMTQIEGEK